MDSVLRNARTFFTGGSYQAPELQDFHDAIEYFHNTLADLAGYLGQGTEPRGVALENLLQGPLSDAMTHVGQLAILRRMAGSPVPPENLVFADIRPTNLGANQALPVSPDKEWLERP